VPRAIHVFKTKTVYIDDSIQKILIPNDIDTFLFDYKNSKFVECNRPLAEYNLNFYKPINSTSQNYSQNKQKNQLVLKYLNYTTTKLEKLSKRYWLAGGTLLGWYRDCGVIPHTTDVDIAIFEDELSSNIRDSFLGDKVNSLSVIFGFKNDSYEIRLRNNDKLQFDIFVAYKYNTSLSWCGYQIKRKKYRYFT
jgi:phosphorylcholine metabolism protein LicD